MLSAAPLLLATAALAAEPFTYSLDQSAPCDARDPYAAAWHSGTLAGWPVAANATPALAAALANLSAGLDASRAALRATSAALVVAQGGAVLLEAYAGDVFVNGSGGAPSRGVAVSSQLKDQAALLPEKLKAATIAKSGERKQRAAEVEKAARGSRTRAMRDMQRQLDECLAENDALREEMAEAEMQATSEIIELQAELARVKAASERTAEGLQEALSEARREIESQQEELDGMQDQLTASKTKSNVDAHRRVHFQDSDARTPPPPPQPQSWVAQKPAAAGPTLCRALPQTLGASHPIHELLCGCI